MMNDEDQELFLEMLLKLDETHDSIKAASKWCRANAACHEEIVRMWFFAVAKATTQRRRLYLFHLASDILFTAEPSSIQYFSSFLPQLFKAVPFVRGEEIRSDMKKLFSIWREKKIYNKVVMKRLNKSLKNRNKVVEMSIFKYDKELLFKNLKRVGDLHPACDYLSRGVDFSPSFDNSQALLGTIKERKACQALLASVDSHKAKVTSLVSYMEEMVHLLKMATTTLDLAGNKEQNGVEETKIRILAYGKFENQMKGVLSSLETTWNFQRTDYAKPITPASPEPEEENLYSRRVGTVGVPGDPRLANVPVPPVIIPSVPTVVRPVSPAVPAVPIVPPVVASWGGAPPVPLGQADDVFTRRNRPGSLTPRRDDMAFTNPTPPPLPTDDLPFAVPRPPLPREPLPFASPRVHRDDLPFASPRVHRDDLPFASPRVSRDDLPFASPRVPRDDLPFVSPRPGRASSGLTPRSQRERTPLLDEPWDSPRREDPWDTPRPVRARDEPWSPRVHPQEDSWDTPRPRRPADDPWDTPRRQSLRDEPWSPRPHGSREEPFDTPRPHTSRDEPWERPRPEKRPTPTRDEPWSPVSPLYTGSSWGPPIKKPVYMPCYTGFHLDSQDKSEPRHPYQTSRGRDEGPTQRPGSSQRPKKPLLPDPPRQIPRLGDGPRKKSLSGTRPALLPSPIPSLMSTRVERKNRR